MRILGLDFGSRTVGVAVSDALGITAQGVEIIRRKSPNKLRRTLARIEEIVSFYDVEQIVLGYPKHMNHPDGDRCALTKEFMEKLERRFDFPVELWDERLTTAQARNIMTESGIRGDMQKEYVDEIAAMLILQGYLDSLQMKKKEQAD